MNDPRWTDQTVTLVGRAIEQHLDMNADASTGAWRYICDCGEVMPTADFMRADDLHSAHQAENVLAVLADAGLLVPTSLAAS